MGTKLYFFVIEQCGENIGQMGYYDTHDEAERRCEELSEMFPHSDFYVYPNTSKREPEFLTV